MDLPIEDKTPLDYRTPQVLLSERIIKRPIRRFIYPVLNAVMDLLLRATVARKATFPVDLWLWGQRGNDYARHRRRVNRIKPLRGADLLVAGCGTGRDVESWLAFGPRQVLGVDYFRYDKAWTELQQRTGCPHYGTVLRFVQANLADLTCVEDQTMDVVASDALLEHVRDIPAVLAEFHRVLRKDGVLYATFGPLWYAYHGDHVSGYDSPKHGFNHLLLEPAAYQSYLEGLGPYQHSEDDGRTWITNGMFSKLRPEEYLGAMASAGFRREYVSAVLDARAYHILVQDAFLRARLRQLVRDPLDLVVTGMTIVSRKD